MNAVKGLVAPLPLIGAVAGLLLLTAGLACGVWIWPTAWAFLAAFAVMACSASGLMAVLRPASFQVRQRPLVAGREDRQPLIDALGLVAYVACLAAWVVFIPLDVFRLRLLPPPGPFAGAAGVVCLVAGVAVSNVAIAQNRFAAPTIHEQEGQRLIDSGLYGVVRHPFYAGMLMVYVGIALWLGSWAAALACFAFLIMTLARIVIEERHLRAALPDYAAYARRVRGRLVPMLL